MLWAAAILYNGLGQYEAAFSFAAEAIECVEDCAELLSTGERVEEALRLLAAARAARAALGIRSSSGEASPPRILAAARSMVSDGDFEAAMADGCTWTLAEAIAAALASLAEPLETPARV